MSFGNPDSIVTTSWDDGHPFDLRLADLLSSQGLTGTFYVPVRNSEGRFTMDSDEIRKLDRSHEIGGHTFNHVDLTSMSQEEVRNEIVQGKQHLEQVVGHPVMGFAFPRGRMNAAIVRMAERAGHSFGRTIHGFRLSAPKGFLLHTTLQAYPHTPITYLKNAVRRVNIEGLNNYIFRLHLQSDWKKLARTAFDTVVREGGVWHLWGHSWEIDEQKLWEDLEELFKYISGHSGVHYLTNGELMEKYRWTD